MIDLYRVLHGDIPGRAEEVTADSYQPDVHLEKLCVLSLASLGDTPDKVARSLRDKGIKGKQGSGSRCPIQRFLASVITIDQADVCVYSTQATVRSGYTGRVLAWVDLPKAVSVFLDLFDWPGTDGPYADLIDGSA